MANTRILLVEGQDDEHVFKALFTKHSLPHLNSIQQHGGYGPLLEAIPQRIRESDIEALGIVIDANHDLHARWQSVHERLLKGGYRDIPFVPPIGGLIVNPPRDSLLPRVGAWLMPDNTLPGALEDFLRFLVPAGDPLFEYAEQSVTSIPNDCLRFKAQHRSKALIHTWLAWQEAPGKPFGLAITAKYLSASPNQERLLIDWLSALFFPTGTTFSA
jgi:hypothetical protein